MTSEEIKEKAFEWSVDYKPFEDNLKPKEYARYGYEKGFSDGLKQSENVVLDSVMLRFCPNCGSKAEIVQINTYQCKNGQCGEVYHKQITDSGMLISHIKTPFTKNYGR